MLAAAAVGGWALARRRDHEQPHAAPQADPPTPIDAVVDRYFTSYDKNVDGQIDVGARPYDLRIQEPDRSSVAEVAKWAATDERVRDYEGAVHGNEYTLAAITDLPLLMRVAQGYAPVKPTRIQDVVVTRPMLHDALASMYDLDRDDALSGGELARLGADFPAQKVNFRFVRVLNEGSWFAPDDHDLPDGFVPDDVTAPGEHHDHAVHTSGEPAHGDVSESPGSAATA